MAQLQNHLALDYLFLNRQFSELHQEVDGGRWRGETFRGHLLRHTPVYALSRVAPTYGARGVASHFLHVLADLSPLQLKDIKEFLGRS